MATAWTESDPMDAREHRRCTAKSKRSGERCRRLASVGRTVCSMHGGKSLARPASLAWVNGRHSRTLPKRLLADAVAAMWDPNKLAMINVRINDALSRLERGDSGAVTG